MDLELLIPPIVAIFIGFSVQTAIGFAAGLISLPIILLSFEMKEAVALISIFNLIFSGTQLPKVWGDIDKKVYKDLAVATVIGVCIGVAVLLLGKPLILKKALGIFTICYVIYSLSSKEKIKKFAKIASVFGFMGGFFAGLFSSGAPPFVIYLSNKYDDPKVLRASTIGILAITNVIRPAALLIQGVYTYQLLITSLYMVPFFLLALFTGKKLLGALPANQFKKCVFGFLFLAGIMLLIR